MDLMRMQPTTVGWLIAMIVAIVACVLWGLGELPRDVALVILAICSRRL